MAQLIYSILEFAFSSICNIACDVTDATDVTRLVTSLLNKTKNPLF